MINKKRLVNTFKDLVKIDSISRDEKKVADYIIKKLKKLKLKYKIDNSNKKKSNNNNKLNNKSKNFDERYKELNKYPDLRKNFQTILSKITKS